jgi:hypothetical protein
VLTGLVYVAKHKFDRTRRELMKIEYNQWFRRVLP